MKILPSQVFNKPFDLLFRILLRFQFKHLETASTECHLLQFRKESCFSLYNKSCFLSTAPNKKKYNTRHHEILKDKNGMVNAPEPLGRLSD